MALNLAPFSRWTLRDKAAQRRLALRYAPDMCEWHRSTCHLRQPGVDRLHINYTNANTRQPLFTYDPRSEN